MSKKKKRKFHHSPNPQPSVGPVNNSTGMSGMSGVSAVSASSFSSPRTAPAPAGASSALNVSDAHAQEYQVIKHDLIKVVILNSVFLAGVLALYYTNLNSHYLERWFGQVLKF